MTTREQRLHALMYSNESRDEICERMVVLEELARDMWEICPEVEESCEKCPLRMHEPYTEGNWCEIEKRLAALGIV